MQNYCRTCETIKPLDNFPKYKKAGGVVAYRHICKECNKIKIKEKNQAYYQKVKDIWKAKRDAEKAERLAKANEE